MDKCEHCGKRDCWCINDPAFNELGLAIKELRQAICETAAVRFMVKHYNGFAVGLILFYVGIAAVSLLWMRGP